MLDSSISIYKNFQNLPQNIQQKLLEFEQTYKSLKDLPKIFVKDTPTFIFKSLLVHGDSFDYSKFVYVNAHIKGTITCEKHGDFKQTPNSHLNGDGCPKCRYIKSAKSKTFTTEIFVEKAKKVHNNFYDYSLVDYIHNKKKIKIVCPIHGVFEQTPNNHLIGQGCTKCGIEKNSNIKRKLLEDFIKESNLIHNNFYDYSKFIYKGNKIKGVIICPIHGEFEQIPNVHTRGVGCPKCAGNSKSNLKDFIEKAKIIHKDSKYEYSYDKFVYVNSRTKSTITCEKHGDFEQTPTSHLKGSGCPKCAKEHQRELNRIIWSDKYSEGILYLIECWNDFERFIKIGVTSKTVKERYISSKSMPYNYKILKEIYTDSKTVSKSERKILKLFKSYTPLISFGGASECLQLSEKDFIIEHLENILKL